jgi:hypothetical protein
MAQLDGQKRRIGDGTHVNVWLCDANYPGCIGFGPVFRYPAASDYTSQEKIRTRYDIMHKLGWGHYRDGGSDVCPKCTDLFVKEN